MGCLFYLHFIKYVNIVSFYYDAMIITFISLIFIPMKRKQFFETVDYL